MKTVITIILFIAFTAFTCSTKKTDNDLKEMNLKGNMKSLNENNYDVEEKFGEINKVLIDYSECYASVGKYLYFNEVGNKKKVILFKYYEEPSREIIYSYKNGMIDTIKEYHNIIIFSYEDLKICAFSPERAG